MKELMPFEKFDKIMTELKDMSEKKKKLSEFLENEICEDSYVVISFGDSMFNTLVNLLADEFECWFDWPGKESKGNWWDPKPSGFCRDNDIYYFIYEAKWGDSLTPLTISVGGKKFYLRSTKDLYDYLVSNYKLQHVDTDK